MQGRVIESFLALARQGREGRITAEVRRMAEAADKVVVRRASLWELTIEAGLDKVCVDWSAFAEQFTSIVDST